MRRLLLLLFLLASPAFAQDPVAGAAAGLQQEALPPAPVNAPAAATIFQAIWTAIDAPLEAASADMVIKIANQTHTWVVAGLTLFLAIWCVGQMFPAGVGSSLFFTGLTRELLLGGAALLAVQTYSEFVLPFALREFPGELAALFTAVGTPQQAGIPGAFDAVMNASTQMYEIVVQRIPDSWAVPIIALRLKLELIYLLSYLLVAWGFFMAIVFHSISVLLVTIGPIFVGMAPFAALRGYARGWLSALLATLGIVAMLALVLGIMVRVVNAEAQVLVGMDQNTIMDQQISGYMGVVIVLFILACSMTAIPAVIASIFGGASHLMSPFMAGARAISRGTTGAVGVVVRR